MCQLGVHVSYLEAAGGAAAGAVALEGEVVLGVDGVDVLYGDAALHAAEREARRLLGLLVAEDGDAAVLVLERRLHPLVLGRLALQRVQADAAVRRAHHRHRVLLVHTHSQPTSANIDHNIYAVLTTSAQ